MSSMFFDLFLAATTLKLSILIPTLPSRRDYLNRLMDVLTPQLSAAVEVLTDSDPDASTGAKRNRLVARSAATYVAHVDDDDLVAPDYCRRILAAIESRPDVVTFWVSRYS